MKDYEQLYYDLVLENRKLKKRIEELETDLEMINNSELKKLNLKKEIMKEIIKYKEEGNHE
jgi:cell division septum initiation protein DivIVA